MIRTYYSGCCYPLKTKETDHPGQPLLATAKMADTGELLSLLVSVLAKAFLTLVRCHFMPFMLLSVWHS